MSFSLEETGTDQTNPTFWGLQNWFWRGCFMVRFPPPPPKSHDTFCPPLCEIYKLFWEYIRYAVTIFSKHFLYAVALALFFPGLFSIFIWNLQNMRIIYFMQLHVWRFSDFISHKLLGGWYTPSSLARLVAEGYIDPSPRYFWKHVAIHHTSHWYYNTFAEVCPLAGWK